ncbi:hypothetical protein BGZ76_000870 [Entomortierella beljakovae]|nr:hypothetical protein BGZ76_000870 [Entomortierella beljakovae]
MDTKVTPPSHVHDSGSSEREHSPTIIGVSRNQHYGKTSKQPSEGYSAKPPTNLVSAQDPRVRNTPIDQDHSFHQQQQYHSNQLQNNQSSQSFNDHTQDSSNMNLQSDHSWVERQSYHQSSPHHSNATYPLQQYPNQHSQIQHHQEQHSPFDASNQDTPPASIDGQRSGSGVKRRVNKEKLPKGDREEVWPPDVENAFMKALEVLPKLGRRKVLVNGKPCGRNELIADFIFQQTQKIRDRKQVSSHIQVLKNTRKHDAAFMRLLMDSGDGDDEGIPESLNSGLVSTSHSPIPSFYQDHDRDGYHNYDERASQLSDMPSMTMTPTSLIESPSSHYSPIQSHYSHRRDFSQYRNHYRVASLASSDISSEHHNQYDKPPNHTLGGQAIYQQTASTPDSAVSLSSETTTRDISHFDKLPRDTPPSIMNACDLSSIHREIFRIDPTTKPTYSSLRFWPAVFGLYIHYPGMSPISDGWNDESSPTPGTSVHEIASTQDLSPQRFCNIDIQQFDPEKFPGLYDMQTKLSCPFLYLKLGVNLDLSMEGSFENTCIYDSNEQRTVRCLTLIYSFGAKVMESTEVKQAALVNGKLVHNFEFVNQFFNAFLSGIIKLVTIDEVDVALNNLSLIQVYEDLDSRTDGGNPLLVTTFDFTRGHGSVTPYRISSEESRKPFNTR